jgi:hypothetical protein
MNKIIIRIFAALILCSPFVYVSSVYKDLFLIISGLVILSATITLKKKKKSEDESGDKVISSI